MSQNQQNVDIDINLDVHAPKPHYKTMI